MNVSHVPVRFGQAQRTGISPRLSLLCFCCLLALAPFFAGCGGGGGSGNDSGSSTVTSLVPAVTLTSAQTELLRGQSTTLTWSASNANNVVQSNFGAQDVSGSVTVTPLQTTDYSLTVQNASGVTKTGSVTVRVASVTIAVTPTPAVVDVAQPLSFAAQVTGAVDTTVTWSVQETGGGTITPDGVYTAPATSGTYHVQAVSNADNSKSVNTEVRVRAASGTVTVN